MKSKLQAVRSVLLVLCLLSGCVNRTSDISTDEETTSHMSGESEEAELSILNDPKVGLQIEEENEEDIARFYEWIISRNNSDIEIPPITPEDVMEFVSVPQVRAVSFSLKNKSGASREIKFYSAHDTSSGGRLFIFYEQGYDCLYGVFPVMFLWKTLYIKDFDELKEGVSTLEDVAKIDPATSVNFYNRDDLYDSPSDSKQIFVINIWDAGSRFYSAHVTKDGIIGIKYKKDGDSFVIKEIDRTEKPSDKIVAAINDNDWP